MDVDWQATGSRSELWDRRQDFSKNRMGAQALSRAREELRPRGHLCLCRSGFKRSGRNHVASAVFQPGDTGEVCFRLGSTKFVMRLGVSEIAAEGKLTVIGQLRLQRLSDSYSALS